MFATPTLDGEAIFGQAVRIQVATRPAVHHLAEFFGVNGLFSCFGGRRGRLIQVAGCLVAPDIATLNAYEAAFEQFIDGAGHVLADTRGRSWPNVLFQGDFAADPEGPKPLVGANNLDGSNWLALRYKAAFLGLT